MDKKDLIEITDLVTLALLKGQGILPAHVSKQEYEQRRRILYYFQDTPELQAIVSEHRQGNCLGKGDVRAESA